MKRFYECVCAAEAVVAAALLVSMVALIFLGGVLRTLGDPINWSSDAATALFAWACFLCADIAWRNDALMSIDLFTQRMPEKLRKLCMYCNYAIIIAFLIFVFFGGIYLSWISRERSFQGIPEVSYSWVTMSMPVGAVLLFITALLKLRQEMNDGMAAAHADVEAPRVTS